MLNSYKDLTKDQTKTRLIQLIHDSVQTGGYSSYINNKVMVEEATQIILKNPDLLVDSIWSLICYYLDVYWNVFNSIVNQGRVLTFKDYSLILIYCKPVTIEKVIMKTRIVLTSEHFRILVNPVDLENKSFTDWSARDYRHYHKNTILEKIKLLQKYGYNVTKEDFIWAIQNKFVLDDINLIGDEIILNVCTEYSSFPKLEWHSEELRKKYEFRSCLVKPKVPQIRSWLKKNKFIPDEDSLCYYGRRGVNIKVLDVLVEYGGKVTGKVLKQTAMGQGTTCFISRVAEHFDA